jgi:molybdopterin converting factor small subunit
MIVKLTGEFATLTGRKEVEIYGPTNIKTLLSALDNAYPNYGWDNSNVAINGVMYSDAWFQPITEDDEVVIMPPIEGG